MDQQQQNRRRAVEAGGGVQNHPPPQPCPRCNSNNTKFCYYNNYSLSQPRFFCKGCRRYWTQGGTLRNVPIGGGCRKSKRPKLASTSSGISGPGESSQAASMSRAMLNHQLILNPQDQRVLMANNNMNNNSATINNNIITSSTTNNTNAGTMMMGHSYYGGGASGFMPSLAGIQGVNQPLYGPNLGLLHGFGLSSFDHQQPQQHPNQLQDVSLPSLYSPREIGSSSTPSMQEWNLRIGSGSVPGSVPGPVVPNPGPVVPDPNVVNNDRNRNRNQDGSENTSTNQQWSNFMGTSGLDNPKP